VLGGLTPVDVDSDARMPRIDSRLRVLRPATCANKILCARSVFLGRSIADTGRVGKPLLNLRWSAVKRRPKPPRKHPSGCSIWTFLAVLETLASLLGNRESAKGRKRENHRRNRTQRWRHPIDRFALSHLRVFAMFLLHSTQRNPILMLQCPVLGNGASRPHAWMHPRALCRS
jgi:hypothetical protein